MSCHKCRGRGKGQHRSQARAGAGQGRAGAGQGRAGQGRAGQGRAGQGAEAGVRGDVTTALELQRAGFHSKCVPVSSYLGVAGGFVHDQVEGLQHAKGRQLLLHLHAHAACLLADSAQLAALS